MARQLPRLVCQPPGWTSTLSTINDLFRASVLWSAPSSSRYRGESLSWYKPGVRLPPRVTIVVQTVGLADWVSLPNPHSCRYRGTNPGFDVLLELLSWCQPLLESLSMVQTGGETLGGKWLCVFPSILWQMVVCVTVHTVRIRVSGWGVEPGGK